MLAPWSEDGVNCDVQPKCTPTTALAIDDQDDVRRGQVIYEDIRTTASPLALDGKYGVET